jgi:lysophospholipid acyltransferase (LPLAT)-like uncharacterized protein
MAERRDVGAARAYNRRRPPVAARLAKSNWLIGAATSTAAGYVRLVRATSRIVYEPHSTQVAFDEMAPFIVTAWHGPAFLLPLVRPRGSRVDVLVSRHSDGELIARVLEKLGMGTIRGAHATDPARAPEKGGISGFMKMKAALAAGRTVAITADSSPQARGTVVRGQIALARASRRPIVPMGLASRRGIAAGSWDRAMVSLPFNRIACVSADAVTVPADADEALLEAKRVEVEAALDAVTRRARAIAGRLID